MLKSLMYNSITNRIKMLKIECTTAFYEQNKDAKKLSVKQYYECNKDAKLVMRKLH